MLSFTFSRVHLSQLDVVDLIRRYNIVITLSVLSTVKSLILLSSFHSQDATRNGTTLKKVAVMTDSLAE